METINCDSQNYQNNGPGGPYEQFFQHNSNNYFRVSGNFYIPEFISCFKIIFQPIRAQGRVTLNNKLVEGPGYFLHVKMPGYRLASLSAATTPHFTACYIQDLLSQNPTACIAYLGGSRQLLIRSTGAIILS